MKIDETSQNVGQIVNLETAAKRKLEEEQRITQGADKSIEPGAKVDLSNTSVEFSRAAEMIDKIPEERSKKIEELTIKVRNDTYDVDSAKIAEKIINDTLSNISEV